MSKWYTANTEVRSSGWANYDKIEEILIDIKEEKND